MEDDHNNKYKRILLKLSGEAFMGSQSFGIDSERLKQYSSQIKEIFDLNVEIAIVVGGGNFFRGINSKDMGIEPVQGDHMGMLATMINCMALQSALENINITTRLQSAITMEGIAEKYIRRRAIRHLEKKRVVIFGSGTGNPFFTTDTAAILRGREINAEVVLKGTRVDGIYSSDPKKNSDAKKYTEVSFEQAINEDLKVMDQTAFTLSKEGNVPIVVFDMNKPGNLKKIISGQMPGTLVK